MYAMQNRLSLLWKQSRISGARHSYRGCYPVSWLDLLYVSSLQDSHVPPSIATVWLLQRDPWGLHFEESPCLSHLFFVAPLLPPPGTSFSMFSPLNHFLFSISPSFFHLSMCTHHQLVVLLTCPLQLCDCWWLTSPLRSLEHIYTIGLCNLPSHI